jgi:predicted metalloprotease with PDZ domain
MKGAMRSLIPAAALIAALSPVESTLAQDAPPPTAQPIADTVPPAVDTPWPAGAIRLDIDASDIQRGVYRVTETLPLAREARRVTLLFPEWLPGTHGPRGPLAELADLRFTVDGKPVAWRRDPVEVYAIHVDLPASDSPARARELVARFVHTSPLLSAEGRITMTPEMLNLQWEKMSLYPAGHYIRHIRVTPTVILPKGWTAAAALDGQKASGETWRWAETDYETLVDSPIFAGTYFRKWDIGNQVTLNVVADERELLNAAPENIAKLSAMVEEAIATFGRPAFDRYEFLVALSDRIGGIGLEHLRSSENQMKARNFVDWTALDWDRNVLAHEFAHAWNGKYRRPARMWTPDYRTPMQDDLLWVYEGQTQFWGAVHAARSGIQDKETVLGMLANWAGTYSEQPGRAWRSVEDTTFDPVFAARKPKPAASLTRGEDYYSEGALIWLEADQIIRAGTNGRKGLDDFARGFFAYKGGAWSSENRVATYEFDDVAAALNRVYPYDWAAFLHNRIAGTGLPAPLGGIERGGYRLVWKDTPNAYDKARMDDAKSLNLYHSLGLSLDREGTVTSTRWDSPAFDAGIVNGAKLVAVNGVAYDHERFKQVITEARTANRPIELLVKRGDRFVTVPLAYKGGLRWPWLERVPGKANAPLDQLLAPRRASLAR